MSATPRIPRVAMRRCSNPHWRLVPILVAFLIAIQVLPATAASPWPFAVGGGWTISGDKFAFSAQGGDKQNRPAGYARYDFASGLTVQGHVRCFLLGTSPGTASFAIAIDKSSEDIGFANGLVFHVLDFGDPGNVGDLIRADLTDNPQVCNPQQPDTPVVRGNIVVDDGN